MFTRARPHVPRILTALSLILILAAAGGGAAAQSPPGQPANPQASLIVPGDGYAQVRVAWDNPRDPGVTGHTITRSDGRTFDSPGQATTYSDITVEPGGTYSYTVTARNAGGPGPVSGPAPADVPDPPTAPGSLAATVGEAQATDKAGTITLDWEASTAPDPGQCRAAYPLTGYTIVRSGNDQETELGNVDASATSFVDSNANFDVHYTYRVTARNAIGTSPASEVSATALEPAPLPATGLTARIADPFDGSISLLWNAPAEGPAVIGYMVFRYLGADLYQGTDIPTTLDELATTTSIVDATAEAGVTYSYIVIARSAANVSLPSETAVIEAPAPAADLAATASDGAIDLTWPAPSAGTAVEYRVSRQQAEGAWTVLSDTSETSYSDGAARSNVQYRYRVQHRNQYGGSTWTKSGPRNAGRSSQQTNRPDCNHGRQRQPPHVDRARQPIY